MKNKKPLIFLRRKFMDVLQRWKSRDDRLPLIVKGARQVGKTACIREFSKNRYASVVEINFAIRPEFKVITQDGYDVANLIRNISLVDPSFRFIDGATLIFFDEIQDFPEIATSFKSFAEDGRYDVISSGSLLGIQLKRIESISVGYQESETMWSMDFEEFLWAQGYSESQLDDVYGRLVSVSPFGRAAIQALDRRFIDYCVLGGMPEVEANYIVKGTFEGVPSIQRRIVADYRSDVRKYAEGLDPQRIISVFDSVPAQLAKENKKFQIGKVVKGARYKDYWGCVEWLQDAGIVTLCKALDFPELPIVAHVDAARFKLYMADSGLLLSRLDEESQDDFRIRRNLGTWKGGLFENIIAEALVKTGVEPVYYKKENSSLEMDFLMRSSDALVPVEVKAENSKAKSLRILIDSDNYRDIRWGVKLVRGDVGFEGKVLTVPQWAAFMLRRLLKETSFTRRISLCL